MVTKRRSFFLTPLVILLIVFLSWSNIAAAAGLNLSPVFLPLIQRAISHPAPMNVIIKHIEYDPDGNDVEGEYVRIRNKGTEPITMTNWTLEDDADHTYTFQTFTLDPDAKVNVWTKEGTNTTTDLYWGRTREVWNNDDDCATLRDAQDNLVDELCY